MMKIASMGKNSCSNGSPPLGRPEHLNFEDYQKKKKKKKKIQNLTIASETV
jgi:hypothetical protein